jgi:hypothetical protein
VVSQMIESAASKRVAFEGQAMAMYDGLRAWRAAHPQATFDEIAAAVKRARRPVLGALVEELAVQGQVGWAAEPCPQCGGAVSYKGLRKKQVVHEEGEAEIERPYYHCQHCGRGFSPLGRQTGVGEA